MGESPRCYVFWAWSHYEPFKTAFYSRDLIVEFICLFVILGNWLLFC